MLFFLWLRVLLTVVIGILAEMGFPEVHMWVLPERLWLRALPFAPRGIHPMLLNDFSISLIPQVT